MQLYHIIDSGNTNLKLTSFNHLGEVISHSQNLSKEQLEKLVVSFLNKNEKVASCSVNLEIREIDSFDLIKKTLEFKTNYSNTLGNDRFAISYYLQRKYPNIDITIINIGTFTTVDYLSNGVHLGGEIYLGPQTYLDSYSKAGKNLPGLKIEDLKEVTTPSLNTNEAIVNTLNTYMNVIFNSTKGEVFLTGGASRFFLRDNYSHDQHLLAKALFYIFASRFWNITN